MNIRSALETVISGQGLSRQDSYDVFREIMEGKATDTQIAALITALRMKGATIDEITGAAEAMREKATPVIPASTEFLVDTCGTGGDKSGTFNISTVSAFVAAGAGARVAKHGNRSVSSTCGSADVLEALGVSIDRSPEVMKRCLDEIGICFLFASKLHSAMKYAMPARKEIGIRTIFNILGPLTNPSGAPRQLLGVYEPELTEIMAGVLANLGSKRVFVVHGMERIDEVSISGPTRVSELAHGRVTTTMVTPADFGFSAAPLTALRGGSAAENAAIARAVLSGEKGPRRDIVVLNAGFAIAASGRAETPAEGMALAKESLDSGGAMTKLEQLITLTK